MGDIARRSEFKVQRAVVRAGALVLSMLLAGACAVWRPPFPADPKQGTLFNSFSQPGGLGPFPAVVLLHTCGGVGPHLFDWTYRLRAHGYAAVTVDSFTPRGAGACNVPTFFPATLDQVTDDAFAALEHLRTRPGIDPRRIGVMGFSYGASAALRTSRALYRRGGGGFRAAVAFYPLCVGWRSGLPPAAQALSNNLYGDVEVPTLILMGEADTDTPNVAANCASEVERLRRAGRPVDIRLFPGVGHVFDVHHADARRAAATAMLQFFDEHLGREAAPR